MRKWSRRLKNAAKDAGAMVEIIAPHVAGAKLSDGKMMEADEKIDGGPSVVYRCGRGGDGRRLRAKRTATDKPSIDFVNDAFAHAKFIAYVPRSSRCSKAAGVAKWMDDGFVDVSKGSAAKDFIETCGKLRFWDRDSVKQG